MIFIISLAAIIGLIFSPVVTFCVMGVFAILYYFAKED